MKAQSAAPESDLRAILLSLEMALMQPEVRHNRIRLEALLDEEFCEIGASGRAWSREEILDLLASEQHDEPPRVSEFQLRILAANITPQLVLVTYRTHSARRGAVLRSSLWRNCGTQWRCVFHQGTVQSTPMPES